LENVSEHGSKKDLSFERIEDVIKLLPVVN
jgi:hypothetical protein